MSSDPKKDNKPQGAGKPNVNDLDINDRDIGRNRQPSDAQIEEKKGDDGDLDAILARRRNENLNNLEDKDEIRGQESDDEKREKKEQEEREQEERKREAADERRRQRAEEDRKEAEDIANANIEMAKVNAYVDQAKFVAT